MEYNQNKSDNKKKSAEKLLRGFAPKSGVELRTVNRW